MTHEFHLPDIGEGLTEADIIEWFVDVGTEVEVDQAIVEIETAKTTVEITATHAGTILRLGGSQGDTIAVGEILFVIGEEGSRADYNEAPSATSHQETQSSAVGEREPGDIPRHGGERAQPGNGGQPPVRAMPIVRKLAKDRDIDISSIAGTGQGGAITRADVERASADHSGTELVAMGRKRRAIARHMSESWATIPHVTVQADIRAEGILKQREGGGAEPIPVEAIVAQAVLPLLTRYRAFNAKVHNDAIEYRTMLNIGIAVDTAEGLMVVVVRDAEQFPLAGLGQEIQRLAQAAKDGTLQPDEAIGQTFTISNIGALGGGHGTPIIPMGTSAILSIGRAKQIPVIEDNQLSIGMVAPIDLSYDHRLIDGSLGQRFLSDLVDALESTGPETQTDS